MKASRRREIGTFAARLRDVLGLETPTNVDLAVERLGGKVDIDDLAHEAMVEKVGKSFRIVLSTQWVSDGRKRFSISHELGHLFLHMGYLVDEAKWASIPSYRDSARYRYGYSEEELEANEFAASFLMPERDFQSVAAKYLLNGKYNVNAIAEEFGVSREAAINRGRWLNMFAWN